MMTKRIPKHQLIPARILLLSIYWTTSIKCLELLEKKKYPCFRMSKMHLRQTYCHQGPIGNIKVQTSQMKSHLLLISKNRKINHQPFQEQLIIPSPAKVNLYKLKTLSHLQGHLQQQKIRLNSKRVISNYNDLEAQVLLA